MARPGIERFITLDGERLIVVDRDEWLAQSQRLAEAERRVAEMSCAVAELERRILYDGLP